MSASYKRLALIIHVDHGAGRKLAISLLKIGLFVIITTKDQKIGEAILQNIIEHTKSDEIEYFPLDISIQSSIREFASSFRQVYSRIDLLIFNSAYRNNSLREKTFTEDSIEQNWASSHIGPILLFGLMLPLLKNSYDPRVLIHIPDSIFAFKHLKVREQDPEFRNCRYRGIRAYDQAILAQTMFIQYIANHKEYDYLIIMGIVTKAIRKPSYYNRTLPFFSRFNMRVRNIFLLSPQKAAWIFRFAGIADSHKLTSGQLINLNRTQIRPLPYARDKDAIERVMTITRKYIVT